MSNLAISSKIADAHILWPSDITPGLYILKKLSHIFSRWRGLLWSAPDYPSGAIFYNSFLIQFASAVRLLIPRTCQARSTSEPLHLLFAWITLPQGISMAPSFPSSFYWNVIFSYSSSILHSLPQLFFSPEHLLT